MTVIHRILLLIIFLWLILLLSCSGSPRYTRATPQTNPVHHPPGNYPAKSAKTNQKVASSSPSKKSTTRLPQTRSTGTKTAKKEIEIQTAFAPEMRIPSGPSMEPPDEEIKEKLKNPDFSFYQKGMASYYSDKLHGRKTASGERYNKKALTAAHRRLPFNTIVKITNTRTRQSVVVRINDRGPFTKGRVIDVSRAAAEQIGMLKSGVANVIVEVQE